MTDRKEYVSPDGRLRLLVLRTGGDSAIGFDGYTWHTHADILASLSGLPEDEAVEHYVQDLLTGRNVVAVLSAGGKVRNIWITDDPAGELESIAEGETIEFRYWDGRKWQAN